MSYSFTVRGANKAEAISAVSAELDKVAVGQPVHAADKAQALAAAETFINLIADEDTRDVSVSVSGSIWQENDAIRSASVSVSASTSERAKA